jgi:hypothetical protein
VHDLQLPSRMSWRMPIEPPAVRLGVPVRYSGA